MKPVLRALLVAEAAIRGCNLGSYGMEDIAFLVTAFSGLTVAVAALLVSLGVLYLVLKVKKVLESMPGGDDSD